MFGDCEGTVKNVNLKDCNFTGHRVAGIAAATKGATIQNCSVLGGTITGTDLNPNVKNGSYIGGIAAYFFSGTVSGCFTTTTYAGNAYDKGPVVGWTWGTLSDSYYSNSINGATNDLGTQVTGGFITLADGITMSGDFRTFGKTAANTYRFAEQGKEITLSCDNVPEGYKAVFLSDDVTITNGVFTMPNKDVSVTADIVIDPAHFSLDDINTYTIHTAKGWELFCNALNDNTYNRFSGKTVMLGADITVSTMAGSDSHDFCGTFDGDKHTLTFNYGTSDSYSNEQYIAPFCYVSNTKANLGDANNSPATIMNLHVDGDIYTSNKFAAGIVAQHWGTLTIENCRSSINIHSSVSGDGSHGGFEAVNNGTLEIKGCVFDGKLLSNNGITTDCGGFIGYRSSGATIYNSLFDPEQVTVGTSGSATFARNKVDTYNCYYTNAFFNSNHDPHYEPYNPQDVDHPDKYNNGKQAYTVTADDGVTIALSGEATEYFVSGITVCADNKGLQYNGTIYAANEEAVGLTLDYTGTPPTGYAFSEFTVSTGTLENGVLTMPAGNVTIGAGFDEVDYSIIIPDFEHGSVTASVNDAPATTAHYNETVTLTLTPYTGFARGYVRINGVDLNPENGVYSFQMPAENVTISVAFDAIDYNIGVADMTHGSVSALVNTAHYGDPVTLEVTPDEGYAVKYIKCNNTVVLPKNGAYSFSMPAEDVTITARFDLPKAPVSYLDEDGEPQSVTVYDVLDENVNTLETGWYVFSDDIEYSGRVNVSGDAILILSDNCTLNANAGIGVSEGNSLTIYAQSDGDEKGVLYAMGKNNCAGIGGGNGTSGGNITINGGQVTSSGGYNGNNGINGTITLGYTNATDYIHASSFRGTVTIADGKEFTDGTNVYYSETSSNTLMALTDATLTPASAYPVTVSDCDHGTVTAPERVFEGDCVTVTVKADAGCSVRYVKYNGTEIEPENGVYSFTMPDEAVTITAKFVIEHVVNLAELTGDYEAKDDDVLTGTLEGNKKITIAEGATVTLRDADITSLQNSSSGAPYAGITPQGDATIILEGTNAVMGGHEDYPGISIPENHTLTIKGDGSLEVSSNGIGTCAIGGKYLNNSGNIVIKGGTITATGGKNCAAIGSSCSAVCGDITISGGNVYAEGGQYGAGIGSGEGSTCGDITITENIIQVSAQRGYDAEDIGSGYEGSCGTITISNALTDNDSSNPRILYPGHILATLVDNADNTAVINGKNGKTCETVTLSGRTLYKDGAWNTLCLPFDVSTTSGTLAGDNVKAMTLDKVSSGLSGTTLTLNFIKATTIPAGKPFIIKWDGDGTDNLVNPVFTNVTIDNTKRNTRTDYVEFVGTYSPVDIYTDEKTNLYLGSGNTLYYPWADGMTEYYLNACRAYFHLKNGLTVSDPVSGVRIVLDFGDGESAGITTTNYTNLTNYSDAWYTINGVKLDGKPTKPGLYINNGRKVVIK